MNLFTNGPLDPANDPAIEIWASTLSEIKRRGFEVHGSLRKRNVSDGATAMVLKATESKSGRVVAIKVYKEPNRKVKHRNGDLIPMTNFFENERRMLAGLQSCPHVPRYYFSVATDNGTVGEPIQPFHVMEFVEGKRITEYTKGLKGSEGTASKLQLFRAVLNAVQDIHEFGYLHRDLSDGNILVTGDGAGVSVRLIDLAEASPLGAEHTRLISTPGYGTEGVATPQQQEIRKIQTDDVRDACTIGHAIFTGKWKSPDGGCTSLWKRNLQNAGVENSIASIVAKGMKPRDTNRSVDRSVWNTAREVDTAISQVLDRKTQRTKLARMSVWFAIAASILVLISFFAVKRIQRQGAIVELNQLKNHQIELRKTPEKIRSDARVQQRVSEADMLEKLARQAIGDDHNVEASTLFAQATEQIDEAIRIADDLARLEPLVEPLRKLLENNDRWNHDCPIITEQLLLLGKSYKEIQQLIAIQDNPAQPSLPSPSVAWNLLRDIQPKLFKLIDDNQQSLEIEALLEKLENLEGNISPELKQKAEYQPIVTRQTRGKSHFEEGKWALARIELVGGQGDSELGAIPLLEAFLDKYEPNRIRELRMAELLRVESSLREQLKEKEEHLERFIADEAKQLRYEKERDDLQRELSIVRSEKDEIANSLAESNEKLRKLTNERNQLAKTAEEYRAKIVQYENQLKEGMQTKKRSKDLVDLEHKVVRNDLLRQQNEKHKWNDNTVPSEVEVWSGHSTEGTQTYDELLVFRRDEDNNIKGIKILGGYGVVEINGYAGKKLRFSNDRQISFQLGTNKWIKAGAVFKGELKENTYSGSWSNGPNESGTFVFRKSNEQTRKIVRGQTFIISLLDGNKRVQDDLEIESITEDGSFSGILAVDELNSAATCKGNFGRDRFFFETQTRKYGTKLFVPAKYEGIRLGNYFYGTCSYQGKEVATFFFEIPKK